MRDQLVEEKKRRQLAELEKGRQMQFKEKEQAMKDHANLERDEFLAMIEH